MKNSCYSLAVLPLLTGLALYSTACAHITFHGPAQGQHRNIGVEYYKPKLYLLVTKTGEKIYKAEIITLPDVSQPRYALLHPGYGSSNLSLKLSNGILTDVGQVGDTKIPETITAVGSLSNLLKAVNATDNPPTPPGERSFQLFEIIQSEGKFKLREVQIE
jgi:hypothetical protein